MRAKRSWIALLGGVIMLASAACGGDEGGGGSTGGGEADLVASGTAFDPTSVTVASGGDSITISNEDGFDHTFTLDDGSVDETLPAGQTVTVDVDISADTPFHCTIHPQMTGTLTVG
jgi:plastocyanin